MPHPASFIIVGMAGFFAAAAKTPFSTLVIVSEMTGNYNLLLPTLWVCTIAFLLSDEQSIYSSQVESRSLSPAHQGNYVREVLAGLKVGEFLLPGNAGRRCTRGTRPPWSSSAGRSTFQACRWSMTTAVCWAWSAWRKCIWRRGRLHLRPLAGGRGPDAARSPTR